jgi:glycosyltransferase involved in cell wall biosynthesis
MKQDDIVVSVVLLAYNHESYIATAIESVLNQVCSFKFELIIGEDYSIDQTREIVRKYASGFPAIIKSFFSDNTVGAIANELRCLQNSRGKYLAYLEGDDFWTDPLKLQKQVDFLEIHTDYGLVHGDVNHLDQKTGKLTIAYNRTNTIRIPEGNIFEDLMIPAHLIKTMTVCFRRDLFEKYYLGNEEIMKSDWKLIDISIWLTIAKHSKIHYIDEVFATYRLLPESFSRTQNPEKLYLFHQKIYNIRNYFGQSFGCSNETKKEIDAKYWRLLLSDAYNMNDKNIAQKAKDMLQANKIRLTLKEYLMYLSCMNQNARRLIKLISNK